MFGKKIEVSLTDLEIRTTSNGKEFLSLKAGVAFDETVVEMAKSEGVRDAYVPKKEEEDGEEEE